MTSVESITNQKTERQKLSEKRDAFKPRTQSDVILTDLKDDNEKLIFDLTREELFGFQFIVIDALNTIFNLHNINTISPQFLKQHQQGLYGTATAGWFSFLWFFKKEARKTIDIAKAVIQSNLLNIFKIASTPVESAHQFFRVPIILKECIRGLEQKGIETHGIFRVSGNTKRIQNLLNDFDAPPGYGYAQYLKMI